MSAPGRREGAARTPAEDSDPCRRGAGSAAHAAPGASAKPAGTRREPSMPSSTSSSGPGGTPFEIDAWEPSLLRKLLGADNTLTKN